MNFDTTSTVYRKRILLNKLEKEEEELKFVCSSLGLFRLSIEIMTGALEELCTLIFKLWSWNLSIIGGVISVLDQICRMIIQREWESRVGEERKEELRNEMGSVLSDLHILVIQHHSVQSHSGIDTKHSFCSSSIHLMFEYNSISTPRLQCIEKEFYWINPKVKRKNCISCATR